MHIFLTASGTRGDVQPALALALGLKAAGHTVRIAAGSNFAAWIQAYGFECIPLLDMEALMRSPDGVKWVEQGNNQMAQLRIMKRLVDAHADDLIRPVLEHGREADLHISGFTSTIGVAAICEKYKIPLVEAALQPYRASRSGAATLVPVLQGKSIINRLVGALGQRFIWGVSKDIVKNLRQELGLSPLNAGSATAMVNRVPLVNGYSAHVVPHPDDWTPDSATVGYWFLEEEHIWTPPQALTDFLAQTPTPVYIGFGSMSSADPQATFDLVCEAVAQSGQRAVFVTGWSGLKAASAPDNIYVIDKAPHSWLFQRVAGVVHHGGAGTTAAGLRAGKPTLIVPHMADQPFWGGRVHALGVGPKPIPRPKLTVETLARALRALATDGTLRRRADTLGAAIRAEDGVARGVEAIERFARKGSIPYA